MRPLKEVRVGAAKRDVRTAGKWHERGGAQASSLRIHHPATRMRLHMRRLWGRMCRAWSIGLEREGEVRTSQAGWTHSACSEWSSRASSESCESTLTVQRDRGVVHGGDELER